MEAHSPHVARLAQVGWLGRRPGLRYTLTILGLVVLAALCLAPTLKTGYISDDNFSSLKPGVLRVNNRSLAAWILDDMRSSMQKGRFYPLHWLPFNGVFCLIQNVYYYKVYILLLVVSNLLLFILFVRKISGDTGFACLAASLTLMLIQLRAFHDPILSFFGLLQLLVAGTLLSLLALETYLERRQGAWLALSILLYLACLLLYEASYPLFLLHGLLIWRRRPTLRAWVRTSWPFMKAAVFCAFMTAFLRWLHPVDFSLPNPPYYQMNLDPRSVLATLLRQTSGALPLSYFLVDQADLFAGVKQPGAFARWIGRWDVLVITVIALVVCLLSLRREPREDGDEPPLGPDWTSTTLLGVILAILPAVMIALTSRYQNDVLFGRPYVPVYMQYFGVGLLLASAIRSVLTSQLRRGVGARWTLLATAVVVGLTTGVTYRANCATVISLVAPPGSHAFNPASFEMAGARHYHRLNLQAALHSGLLKTVPEHSKVLLSNEYPYWYDAELSVPFYAMHASKVLVPIPPSAQKVLASQPPRRDSTYTVRDVCLGMKVGYVVLSQPDGGRELRLFVRHPNLFKVRSIPAFLVVGDPPGSKPDGSYLKPGYELRLLRSGSDWGLFDLGSEVGQVHPDSLRLVFDPVEAAHMIAALRSGSSGLARRSDGPTNGSVRSSQSSDEWQVRR
jgi:hypothetical protein